MSDFKQFADALNKRISAMSKNELYVVGDDKDALWEMYLASFPEGTNPMFRERTEHDCSTCRQFVKNWGNVVEIKDGKVRTIWSFGVSQLSGTYYEVAYKMDEFVRSLPLTTVFRSSERQYGTEKTRSMVKSPGGVLDSSAKMEVWNHFHAKVANKHFSRDVGTERGNFDAAVQVFKRGIEELTLDALNTVVDLIDSNNLYRGEEHLRSVTEFRSLMNGADQAIEKHLDKMPFIYANAMSPAARFRNTVIGTLVQDISNGVDLETAVRSFESKVAPTNYKRPKALITPAMVKAAMKTINELGIEGSLQRRFANLSDISVNNVLWVNNDSQAKMKDGLEDILMSAATSAKPLPKNAKPEEMSIVSFMKDILPGASEIEIMVKNDQTNNFVSLTTGVNNDAPLIFKWDNDFAWSYGGNVTDSIKEKVKKAGGSVTGNMRVSLSWFNYDDLDIRVTEPNGNLIWYGDRGDLRRGGQLDVDMNAGGKNSREAVENVTWTSRIQNGDYIVDVNNYNKRETSGEGFVIEVESNGKLEQYRYEKPVANKKTIRVGVMTVTNGVVTKFKPAKDIQGGSASKEIWGVNTETFLPVSVVTYSPNHWDDQAVGNRHWFFFLEGCKADQPARGIYNEFLKSELSEKHRKVFEVLGSKTLCEPTDDQLSGVGFSSTSGASLTAKVTMSSGRSRLLSINF